MESAAENLVACAVVAGIGNRGFAVGGKDAIRHLRTAHSAQWARSFDVAPPHTTTAAIRPRRAPAIPRQTPRADSAAARASVARDGCGFTGLRASATARWALNAADSGSSSRLKAQQVGMRPANWRHLRFKLVHAGTPASHRSCRRLPRETAIRVRSRLACSWTHSSNSPNPSSASRSRSDCMPRSSSLRAASSEVPLNWPISRDVKPLQMQRYRLAPPFRQLRQHAAMRPKSCAPPAFRSGPARCSTRLPAPSSVSSGKGSAGRELAARMASITVDSTTLCI